MIRRLAVGLLALASLRCDSTVTLAAAKLSEPVSLATVPTAAGEVVFVANATNDDLRAFVPSTGLFARGPNAISPLSIGVGFRPTRLAGGNLDPAKPGLGYVVVAGALPEVALIDAQTFRRTHAKADVCDGTFPQASCLVAPATDVAVARDVNHVFAAVPAVSGQTPKLLRFDVSEEDGAPVLTLKYTQFLSGEPAGVAATADGRLVYAADASAPRVFEVTVGGGLRTITASAPVTDVVLSPPWLAPDGTAHAEGEYLLALLADGRLQTLDPVKGAPAPDPLDPAKPIAPLSFHTPIRDLAFVPCPQTGTTPCTTTLSTSATTQVAAVGLGFAALGDGTAVALVPDAKFPQIYRPILIATAAATVSAATLVVPDSTTTPSSPSLVNAVVTTGFSRSEVWTLTHAGNVPGFVDRAGTLQQGPGGLELLDADAKRFDSGNVTADDTVGVRPLGAGACGALAGSAAFKVLGASGGTVSLDAGTVDTAGCLPLRVTYRVQAGGALPWTVVGTASGFVGRAGQGVDASTAPVFAFAGERFFYPAVDATSLQIPPGGPALSFAIVGPADTVPGTTLSFSTTSGFSPFTVGTEGLLTSAAGGLANAVAATRERLYVAQVATNRLIEATLALIGQAGAVKVYQ